MGGFDRGQPQPNIKISARAGTRPLIQDKMKAVILAAGRGTRLGLDIPKALIEISGKTIISRQIEQFQNAGIIDIVVIAGYNIEMLEDYLSNYDVKLVENPFFKSTDNLVSLYAASKSVKENCIVSHADLIFDDEIVDSVLNETGDIRLPMDRGRMDAESMKIRLKNGRIVEIGKNLKISEAAGESIPLIYFSERGMAETAFKALTFVHKGKFDAYVEDALSDIIKSGESDLDFQVIDVTSKSWIEIDTPEDFDRAREMFG